MSCYHPVVVPSKAKDAKPGQTMYVPCGKCIGCLIARQNSWIYRLQREQYTSARSYFVTLTYDPEHVPLILKDGSIIRYSDYVKKKSIEDCAPTIYPLDFTNHMKRLRKKLSSKVAYYACMEYGDQFNRPHMHYLLFCEQPIKGIEYEIKDSWPFGMVKVDVVTDTRIAYVTKYIQKSSEEAPPHEWSLPCCQRASHGLGIDGFFDDEKHFSRSSNDYMKSVELNNGSKIVTPRYFRRKFFAQEEFTQSKIDENERNRQKKETRDFERHCQDLLLSAGQFSFEEATSSYLQNHDFERIRKDRIEARKRRKGL